MFKKIMCSLLGMKMEKVDSLKKEKDKKCAKHFIRVHSSWVISMLAIGLTLNLFSVPVSWTSVDWSVSKIGTINSNNEMTNVMLENALVYCYVGNSEKSTEAFNYALNNDFATFANNNIGNSLMTALSNKSGFANKNNVGKLTYNSTVSAFFVVFDSATNPQHFIVTTVITEKIHKDTSFDYTFEHGCTNPKWVAVVPEPSCLTLFILGCSIVGLRRKTAIDKTLTM